ncbi:hypothetical protein AgCh_003120 [Apium graveolens]
MINLRNCAQSECSDFRRRRRTSEDYESLSEDEEDNHNEGKDEPANPTNPNEVEKTELEKYLEEKRLNRSLDIDILEYWNPNQFRFPNLALMARDILSIPISTVASESAFSIGGRILD